MLGYWGAVWFLLALVAALATRRPLARPLLITAACVWTADVFAFAGKQAIGRPRPSAELPQADPLMGAGGSSMPSGHAATAFAGAVALTYLWPRGAPLFVVLALAIAFSRVYVGVHYPGDVLAGAALGVACALGVVAAVRALPRSATARRRSRGEPRGG